MSPLRDQETHQEKNSEWKGKAEMGHQVLAALQTQAAEIAQLRAQLVDVASMLKTLLQSRSDAIVQDIHVRPKAGARTVPGVSRVGSSERGGPSSCPSRKRRGTDFSDGQECLGTQEKKHKAKSPSKDRSLPNLGIAHSEVFHWLVSENLMCPRPLKPLNPPLPPWYKEDQRCEYHMGVPGHSIDTCDAYRHHLWTLLDNDIIRVGEGPNLGSDPLRAHDKEG